MKALANEIYITLYDLDFQDYTETTEKDLKALKNDLQLFVSILWWYLQIL